MKKTISMALMVLLCVISLHAKDNIKTNYRTALVMAYSPANNIYKDENIRLEIYNESLWAVNKTDLNGRFGGCVQDAICS